MEPPAPAHRAVVPQVRVVASPEAVHVGCPDHAPGDRPRVELLQEGGVIQAIEITCTCGRRIRLQCLYAEEG